jgi:hypothetical protein
MKDVKLRFRNNLKPKYILSLRKHTKSTGILRLIVIEFIFLQLNKLGTNCKRMKIIYNTFLIDHLFILFAYIIFKVHFNLYHLYLLILFSLLSVFF